MIGHKIGHFSKVSERVQTADEEKIPGPAVCCSYPSRNSLFHNSPRYAAVIQSMANHLNPVQDGDLQLDLEQESHFRMGTGEFHDIPGHIGAGLTPMTTLQYS